MFGNTNKMHFKSTFRNGDQKAGDVSGSWKIGCLFGKKA